MIPIELTDAQIDAMAAVLKDFPGEMLSSAHARQVLCKMRFDGDVRVHGDISAGVMPGTVAHNREPIDTREFLSCYRTQRLIGPLSALDPVYNRAPTLKALLIGPRTEMEIFHLFALGFRPENVTAVDLISSSPLIDTGDMHALPYADASFDVVICGWVLGYSSTPGAATAEMHRVAKPGALIAVGHTHEPGFRAYGTEIAGCDFANVSDLVSFFRPIKQVCFQQSPPPGEKGVVVMIVRL